jgi:hypothetical protein
MISSQSALASYERGMAHLKRAEYEAAVSAFTEAIRMDPKAPNAYAGRALAYRSLSDEDGALADEQTVRELGGIKPARGEFGMLLTPDFQISQRVDQQAFVDFIVAANSATKGYFEQFPQPRGLEVQVACAALPQDKLLLEIQVQPEAVPDEVLVSLRQRIEALPRPEVKHGPVAFSSRLLIQGGCPECDVAFGFPFASIMKPGAQGLLDDMLMAAAGLGVKSTPWWGKLKRALGLGG